MRTLLNYCINMFFKSIASQSNDTLVLSLDFDGCTDTPLARAKLVEYIVNYCERKPRYKEVRIAIGSLRQSPSNDLMNALRNSNAHEGRILSCRILMEEFLTQLDQELKDKLVEPPIVTRSDILLADILNNLEFGESLRFIQSINYEDYYRGQALKTIPITDDYGRNISYFSQEYFFDWHQDNFISLEEQEEDIEKFYRNWSICAEEYAEYVEWRKEIKPIHFTVLDKDQNPVNILSIPDPWQYPECYAKSFDDVGKCLTLYTLIQHTYELIQKPFDILHFDDRFDLLQSIPYLFGNNKHLLPQNCNLSCIDWNSLPNFNPSLIIPSPFITGTGIVNPDYKSTVFSVINLSISDKISIEQAIIQILAPYPQSIEQKEPSKPKISGNSQVIFAPTPRKNTGDVTNLLLDFEKSLKIDAGIGNSHN